MRSVSIRELHAETGKIVRQSTSEGTLVTDHGRPIALLKPVLASDLAGVPFPKRDLRKMPRVRVDSTIYISEDRDRP